MSLRSLSTAAPLVAATLATCAPAGPVTTIREGDRVTDARELLGLPAPTGRIPVGRASVHLVDATRVDSLSGPARQRELMVQIWYPARDANSGTVAPYMSPDMSARVVERINRLTGATLSAELMTFGTHSRVGVPARAGKHPVVVFSPGRGMRAVDYTGVAEELASRGFVVVGIDHTFDATVEFPGHRIVSSLPAGADPEQLTVRLMKLRLGDVRFVVDQLASLARGVTRVVDGATIPRGLGAALDTSRIGAFGHSFGSPTIAQAMLDDARIAAGAALDGSLPPRRPAEGRTLWGIEQTNLDRPFLLLGTVKHRRAADRDYWPAFWDRLRGQRLWLVVDGIGHYDFTDTGVFSEQLDLSKMFSEDLMLGPIDGARSLSIVRTYLAAWFDSTLRANSSDLLRALTSAFPEVVFER